MNRAQAAWSGGLAAKSPPPALAALGAWNLVIAVLMVLAVALLWKRVRVNGLRRAGTWDCGYAAPTPRMQYTAGSFAGIITEWFQWILRPERHIQHPVRLTQAEGSHDLLVENATPEPFPDSAAFHEHTPETVLERVVEPAARGVMAVSTAVRKLQHGRLQLYILYLVIGLAALALIAFLTAAG